MKPERFYPDYCSGIAYGGVPCGRRIEILRPAGEDKHGTERWSAFCTHCGAMYAVEADLSGEEE